MKFPLKKITSKLTSYRSTEVSGTVNPTFEGDNNQQTDISLKDDVEAEHLKEEPAREQWASPVEFLLSCIAMSVGLGNVWRFPFTAYENGGGAFLIPYVIVLVFVGKPLYYMELCMGQFASYGSVKVWEMVPGFKGVGYGQALATWSVVTYYVSLMALTVLYFILSFFPTLPWASCNEEPNCFDSTTNITNRNISELKPAAEIYFEEKVLKLHRNGLDDGILPPDWKLALSLLVSWIILFLVLVKGVKSSGKIAYFTALFPYVVIFILLGRGASLPGASNGMLYFIKPDWSKLLLPTVWFKAVGQAFFSLSVGFGSIIMFSSYNSFRHNVYRDAAIISLVDTLTSFLAGLTIFAILGHLASEIGVSVDEVLKGGGSGLAFISYPDVLARFDYVPQLFAVLFFLMLFTLGVGSASALTGCIITIISDEFPNLPNYLITICVCISGFLLGLFYVTPQGQYILDLVDYFGGQAVFNLQNFVIYILAFLEVVAVHWIYGMKNFIRDIEFMLGRKTGIYWRLCWSLIIPLLLIYIFINTLASQESLSSGGYVFQQGALAFGICLAVLALLFVPAFMIRCFVVAYMEKHSFSYAFWSCFKPSLMWSPKDPSLMKQYKEFLQERKEERTIPVEEYLGVSGNIVLTPWFYFKRIFFDLGSYLSELYWKD